MAVGPGDFVKVNYIGRDVPVRNKEGDTLDVRRDTKPLKLMWDSRVYMCEVGKEAFVPFEAMSVAFGDPRSSANVASLKDEAGNTMFISDRATEVRRLRTLYDNQIGIEDQILYAPEATITDIDGETVTTVLHDPEGESVTPAQTTLLDRDQLLAQLQRQQRMIETLAKAQGITIEGSEEPEPEEEPEDIPADK